MPSSQQATSYQHLATILRERLAPVVARWWANPLFRHSRLLRPLPLRALRRWLPIAAGVLAGVAALAWLAGGLAAGRITGAVLTALSFGAVLIPVLAAPVATAGEAASQVERARQNPALYADLEPGSVAGGLASVGLWRLRWLLAVALMCTPALVVGVLRLEVAGYRAWRDGLEALGGAAAASQTAGLLPGGRIPAFRLALRALSAGLLPWALLPLMAALGVAAAYRLADPGLGRLVALLGGVVAAVVVGLAWAFVSSTPLLAGPLEAVRLLLLGGLLAGPVLVARWLVGLTARQLGAE